MIHTQYSSMVKIVRTDNGIEFDILDEYFKEHGIIRQTSCIRIPKQNGRV